MTFRSLLVSLALTSVLILGAWPPAAQACVANVGYTGTTTANASFMATNLGADSGYVGAPGNNPAYNLEPEVSQIRDDLGPVFINLKDLIFDPTPVTVNDCDQNYERGPATSVNKTYHRLRSDYRSRLDTWFAANDGLFEYQWFETPPRQVYGLIVHDEANNACAQNESLRDAAQYVRQKLDQTAGYEPIYVIVGYGLRNVPNGPVSFGLPVTPSGAIDQFPAYVDVIGYSAYDIFNPANDNDSLNLNAEKWSAISSKLDQALRPGQSTGAVLKGFCTRYDPAQCNPPSQTPGDPQECLWDIECPPYYKNHWKLGVQATNWVNYLKNDPRNLFLIVFHWPDAANFVGTANLPEIWSHHASITPNCSMPAVPRP